MEARSKKDVGRSGQRQADGGRADNGGGRANRRESTEQGNKTQRNKTESLRAEGGEAVGIWTRNTRKTRVSEKSKKKKKTNTTQRAGEKKFAAELGVEFTKSRCD